MRTISERRLWSRVIFDCFVKFCSWRIVVKESYCSLRLCLHFIILHSFNPRFDSSEYLFKKKRQNKSRSQKIWSITMSDGKLCDELVWKNWIPWQHYYYLYMKMILPLNSLQLLLQIWSPCHCSSLTPGYFRTNYFVLLFLFWTKWHLQRKLPFLSPLLSVWSSSECWNHIGMYHQSSFSLQPSPSNISCPYFIMVSVLHVLWIEVGVDV